MFSSPFIQKVFRDRSDLLARQLVQHIPKRSRVLDFGCGTMVVADMIGAQTYSKVFGVDVSVIAGEHKRFSPYDGKHIPFPDQSFDVTYAAYVFHHIDDFLPLLKECRRVTKKRLIIVEDVYRNPLEHLMIAFADFGNWIIDPSMHIPLNFRSENDWILLCNALSPKKVSVFPVKTAFPRPTQHRIFVVEF